MLTRWSDEAVTRVAARVQQVRRPGDLVVMSIHWGGNWGYQLPRAHRQFAHRLIDDVDVNIMHGHSSHHPLGIEVYRERPILYGCGDFLNDYEGISGHEEFKSDRVLAYFARMDPKTGTMVDLSLIPFQIRRFSLRRGSRADAEWLGDTLTREGRSVGTSVEVSEDDSLLVRW